MTDNYIGIMIESLRRKKDVLTDILKLSEEQSLLLDDPNLEPDTFEKNVNRKAALIEKLEQLDTGFESLYDKVKEELESNRDIHKEQADAGTDQGTYRIEYADSGDGSKK